MASDLRRLTRGDRARSGEGRPGAWSVVDDWLLLWDSFAVTVLCTAFALAVVGGFSVATGDVRVDSVGLVELLVCVRTGGVCFFVASSGFSAQALGVDLGLLRVSGSAGSFRFAFTSGERVILCALPDLGRRDAFRLEPSSASNDQHDDDDGDDDDDQNPDCDC